MPPPPIKLTTPPTGLPHNSLILITGVNGLIAIHIADQCLAFGYRVRGTVRDLSRDSWLIPLFTSRYGANRFQLLEVPDLAVPGIWTEHLKGVSGVVSVAGYVKLGVGDGEELDKAVEAEMRIYSELFRAADESTKGGDNRGVKAFVFTSSAWAAWAPQLGVKSVVTEESWNEEAVRITADKKLSRQEKGRSPFMTSKVRAEKAFWDWVEKNKPSFRVNAILPDTVIGSLFDGGKQDNSPGVVGWVYRGEKTDMMNSFTPQWFVNATDNARLYVGALAMDDADGWRVFGCGERFNCKMILDVLKKIDDTGKTDWVELEDPGLELSDIGSDKGLRLLRFLGQEKWTGLEETVRDVVNGV